MTTAPPDVFEELRQRYTIAQAWQALGLPGEPKEHGMMRSPFRDERTPSFSIFDNGTGFKDHGTGVGGDLIEFIRVALDSDHAAVREWGKERLGIDHLDGEISRRTLPQRPVKEPEPPKPIEWPGGTEPFEITAHALDGFARSRGITYKAAHVAQAAGLLRFLKIDGRKCYVVTDNTRRCAEIRAIDGSLFGGKKAFPLPNVCKAWLPGLAGMETAPKSAGVFIAEGCSDLLSALALYTAYKCHGGPRSWIISGLFGASCKSLTPEAQAIIRGRRVRLCPDGDEAGDRMAEHWKPLLLSLGCTVDVVKLPRGKDLSDMRHEITPEELFCIQ